MGRTDLPKPQLGMTEEQAVIEFERLQRKLQGLWKSIETLSEDEQTIVVVPSLSVDIELPGSLLQAYEERFLFILLLLRQPKARLIYITSQPIQPNIIDYYLDLLPGVITSHAQKRLLNISPQDPSSAPLSTKLLQRPKLLARIRAEIPDPDRAHMVPFNTTNLERDLAIQLGIPMYGADPKYFPLGTKSGCRQLFEEINVPYPIGREDLTSEQAVIDALCDMRRQKPSLEQIIIKLNEGVSGMGNALIDLSDLPAAGTGSEAEAVGGRIRDMTFEVPIEYNDYIEQVTEAGAVVEERICGEQFHSPSVQLRVTPLGELEVLSTHDQLLGGEEGTSYMGCVFPANVEYASKITTEAVKVGERLAELGVLGRFAIDFVAARSDDGEWQIYAIELNLRKGGTTHPFLTLQFLTDGIYDPETGIFTAPGGQQKCFVSSDHVESPYYRLFSPDDLFDIIVRHRLHFDQTRQKGVVFHLMSALGDNGQCGLTAVGDSHEEAREIYEKTLAILDEEAKTFLTSHVT